MKYFFDTEFIERPGTIELISIGVVCEDGRAYYAISTEFDKRKANDWVKENVLSKLPERYINTTDISISPSVKEKSQLWKSRDKIKNDILAFIGDDTPEFWSWYADYDWVVFCWLFGTMMDLPENYPMYCRDIQQLIDEKGNPEPPKQEGSEHDALDDAFYHKKLYEWVKRL